MGVSGIFQVNLCAIQENKGSQKPLKGVTRNFRHILESFWVFQERFIGRFESSWGRLIAFHGRFDKVSRYVSERFWSLLTFLVLHVGNCSLA